MRKKILILAFVVGLIYGSVWLGNDVVLSPQFYLAIIIGVVPVAICVWIILRGQTPSKVFLLRLFFAALAVRYLLAYFIYSRNLQSLLGADAGTYDAFGYELLRSWMGLVDPNAYWLVKFTGARTSGFGMFYWVAGIYFVIGQSAFAIQLINCALGAGTTIAAYKIAIMVYPSERIARWTAIATAFSPSLVLWTSQGLKDGPIMLCLCLCVLFALRIRNKIEFKSFSLLLISLLCLYTLRHYAAYIMLAAVVGGLLFTMRKKFTPLTVLQGALLVVVIGVAFSYFGAGEVAIDTIDFKQIQRARVWGAQAANTGFGGDVDITDTRAAIEYLPLGVVYALLAPFPWMINSFRQMITLPELVVWWLLMPMMIRGYGYALRHRLRQSFVICTFVVGLTLAFALYQSNAGTAYRHRSQLYPFFILFICIGIDQRRLSKLEKRAHSRQPSFVTPLPQGLTNHRVKVQAHRLEHY